MDFFAFLARSEPLLNLNVQLARKTMSQATHMRGQGKSSRPPSRGYPGGAASPASSDDSPGASASATPASTRKSRVKAKGTATRKGIARKTYQLRSTVWTALLGADEVLHGSCVTAAIVDNKFLRRRKDRVKACAEAAKQLKITSTEVQRRINKGEALPNVDRNMLLIYLFEEAFGMADEGSTVGVAYNSAVDSLATDGARAQSAASAAERAVPAAPGGRNTLGGRPQKRRREADDGDALEEEEEEGDEGVAVDRTTPDAAGPPRAGNPVSRALLARRSGGLDLASMGSRFAKRSKAADVDGLRDRAKDDFRFALGLLRTAASRARAPPTYHAVLATAERRYKEAQRSKNEDAIATWESSFHPHDELLETHQEKAVVRLGTVKRWIQELFSTMNAVMPGAFAGLQAPKDDGEEAASAV